MATPSQLFSPLLLFLMNFKSFRIQKQARKQTRSGTSAFCITLVVSIRRHYVITKMISPLFSSCQQTSGRVILSFHISSPPQSLALRLWWVAQMIACFRPSNGMPTMCFTVCSLLSPTQPPLPFP